MSGPRTSDGLLALDVLGTRVDVDLTRLTAAERAAVAHPWRRCLAPPGSGPAARRFVAAVGPVGSSVAGVDAVVAPSWSAVAERLTTRVTVAAIDARAADLLLLHAGAVADPVTGAVVAYVGGSGSGKTTASAALATRLAYLSDETTAVRDDLTVLPYPKPLSVVRPGTHHRKAQLSPDDLGLLPAPDAALRLVAVVLLDRRTQPGPARLAPVGLAEAAPRLLPQVSHLARRPRPLQRLSALAAACGGLQQVRYHDAAALPAVFRAVLDDPAVAGRLARSGRLADTKTRQVEPTWRRAPAADTLAVDGALLVLHGTEVTVLGGIAPVLHAALDRPRTLAGLVATVLAEHGAPAAGDPEGLVRAALNQLVAGGVLHRTDP